MQTARLNSIFAATSTRVFCCHLNTCFLLQSQQMYMGLLQSQQMYMVAAIPTNVCGFAAIPTNVYIFAAIVTLPSQHTFSRSQADGAFFGDTCVSEPNGSLDRCGGHFPCAANVAMSAAGHVVVGFNGEGWHGGQASQWLHYDGVTGYVRYHRTIYFF
jgi:hypothetical protein